MTCGRFVAGLCGKHSQGLTLCPSKSKGWTQLVAFLGTTLHITNLKKTQAARRDSVLRKTASLRLSQRYPSIARCGFFGVSTWPWLVCDTPSPLSERFPQGLWRACEVEARYPPPPPKGVSQRYLRDTLWKQGKTRAIPSLCDTISKGYCAIWGGDLALGR